MKDLNRRLAHYAIIALVVMSFSLVASVLLTRRLQERISEPILNLATAVMKIGEAADYSIRVHHRADDELGILYNEFNRMLDRIETSDKALKQTQDSLEERVIARTAELSREIERRERVQAGAAQGTRCGRGCQSRQERLPGQHEPRDPHAYDGHPGIRGIAAGE